MNEQARLRRVRRHLEKAAMCLDERDPRTSELLNALFVCLDECVTLEHRLPRRSARILPFIRPKQDRD